MLTETEKKELNIELENDIVLSKKLAEDFCVYLATYNTSIKDFVCHLTEQDYNKMQTVKFCGSNSEQVFLDDLPDRTFVDVKTYALTKDNFAMGFHPAFWNVLTNIERMALCQIALENFSGKTFQKFCYQDNTNDVVLLSNENDGVLNIFSFYNAELTGLDVLFGVANSENDIKRTLYAKRPMV